jgi:hypothetical protein
MGYTLLDMHGDAQPIRLLTVDNKGEVQLGKEFSPHWWRLRRVQRTSETL